MSLDAFKQAVDTLVHRDPNHAASIAIVDAWLSELQPPSAATQERETLREMTSALKGFVEWHGGAHVGPCPEDDTCDCPGMPYNDAVNEVIRKADAILRLQPAAATQEMDSALHTLFIDTFAELAKRQQALDPVAAKVLYDNLWTLYDDSDPDGFQPAAAAPQDETLALVNQALTKAGSRHIVGTKDGVIVACTIEEALQPAAAAPPIDMEPIQRRFDTHYMHCEPGTSQKTMREDMRVLLARLRALQGTTKAEELSR